MAPICQQVSNVGLGPITLESAEMCYRPTDEYTGSMDVTVKVLGYDIINQTFPVGTTVPVYEASSNTEVIMNFGTLGNEALATLLQIGEDVNNLAQAVGYSGVLNIQNAHVDQNGNLVFDLVATSPPILIILAIVFVIALAILIWIAGQSASVVLNSISGSAPSPPNCSNVSSQQCAQLYPLYYQAYSEYASNKGGLTGVFNELGILLLVGGLVLIGLYAINRYPASAGRGGEV